MSDGHFIITNSAANKLRGAQEATRVRNSGAQARAELKRAHAEALQARIRSTAARLWPGQSIPVLDGGFFFRTLSDQTGEPEGVLAEMARAMGLWVCSPLDVWAAVRDRGEGRL